jgi:hypothetical protein
MAISMARATAGSKPEIKLKIRLGSLSSQDRKKTSSVRVSMLEMNPTKAQGIAQNMTNAAMNP